VGDDIVGVLGQGEWVGAFVPAVDVGPDRGLEVFDAVEGGAADRLPVMMLKKISAMFSQEPEVGVKCS